MRPFNLDEPFPIQDVVFEWAQAYFYYARSRQRPDGTIPALRSTAYYRSPVTMEVGRVAQRDWRLPPELIVHEIPSVLLR